MYDPAQSERLRELSVIADVKIGGFRSALTLRDAVSGRRDSKGPVVRDIREGFLKWKDAVYGRRGPPRTLPGAYEAIPRDNCFREYPPKNIITERLRDLQRRWHIFYYPSELGLTKPGKNAGRRRARGNS